MVKADLHLHTNFSDGLMTPDEVIGIADKNNLRIISITDHDNIAALTHFNSECNLLKIELINGIELSSFYNDREVHILGYNINIESELLKDYLKSFRIKRLDRFDEMVMKLNKLGCKFSTESVIEEYDDTITLGRPHLAKYLVRHGFVKDIQEAFSKYLGDYRYANVRKDNPPVGSVINLIKECEGISFIAHPGKSLSYESLSEIVKLGINGIEIIHPSHSASQTESFKTFAERYKLLMSGGSDFHGISKYDFDNIGKYYIESEEIEKILNYKNN